MILKQVKTDINDISLEEAKNLQKDYNQYLNKIRNGNKNEEQKKNIGKYEYSF